MDILGIDDLYNPLFFPLSQKSTLSDLNTFLCSQKDGVYEVYIEGNGVLLLSDSLIKTYGQMPLYEAMPTTQRVFVRRNGGNPCRPLQLNIHELTGRHFDVLVHSHARVYDLKVAIQNVRGYPPNQQRFVANSIGFDKDEDTLARYGIHDGCPVHLILRLRGGGGSVPFVDVGNEAAKQTVQLSFDAPSWRIVVPGLHIEGKCTNKDCKAFKHTTMSRHNTGLFDVLKTEPKCPCCRKSVKGITMGFYDCFYRMRAKKTGSTAEMQTPWTEVGEEYLRWNEQKAGVVDWDFLEVEVRTRDRCMTAPSNTAVKRAPVSTHCAMCFGNMYCDKPDETRMLPCLHSFHSECLSQWKETSIRNGHTPTCPLCRAEF